MKGAAVTGADRPVVGAGTGSSGHAGDGDIELQLTFEQAALGTTATVQTATSTPCVACTGAGAVPGERCDECAGAGFHTRSSGGINIRTECRACEGAGRAAPTPCERCGGCGTLTASRAVTIRVPAGVRDGARLRFVVPGSTGSTPRHAVVRVAAHEHFTRDGDDLRITLPVTIAEAALGATVTVPTLDGPLALRVPPGTRDGRTLRVRGRGVPAASGAGDLLATVEVSIPDHLSEAQRRALEAYAAATPSPRRHFDRHRLHHRHDPGAEADDA